MNSSIDQDEIWQKLTEVFRKLFDDSNINLKFETSAWDIPGWDSIMHLQIILSTEKEFQITFTTPEILSLKHVGDLYSLIALKTQRLARKI